MKKLYILLLVFLFQNTLYADVAKPTDTTQTQTSSFVYTEPSGICGVADFMSSPNSLRFDDSILIDGIKDLTLGDTRRKMRNVDDISGFRCPDLSEIKDPSIPKDVVNEVTLANVNFSTGEYECHYNFANNKGSYVLHRVNKGCLADTAAAYYLASNPNKMPNYEYYHFYGLSTLNNSIDFSSQVKTLSSKLNTAIQINKENMKKKKTGIDLKSSLDSHTNFSKTIPSILTGVLTLDPNFFENKIVSQTGELQLKKSDTITSVSTAKNEGNTIRNIDDKITSLFNNLGKKTWGFYYYLMQNISTSFKYIITMIFGLGTIGLFGYAFLRKSLDKQGTFDFNYTHKFVGIISAIAIFSAPLVPTHKGVPDEFIYSKTSNNPDEIISNNSIVADTLLRYAFQESTFWANTLNDYAMYAYLKYFETSYGIFETDKIKDNFTESVDNILQNNILLKKKMNFFEKTCAYNYYTQLSTSYTLPDYYGGVDSSINMIEDKPLGYDKVDYKTCAKIYKDIENETVAGISDYQAFVKKYDDIQKTISKMDEDARSEVESVEQKIVGINNKFGWLSVVMVPGLNYVFEAKDIFKYANSYGSGEEQDNNEKLMESLGSMQYAKTSLIKNQNEELEKGKSQKAAEISWWEKFKYKLSNFSLSSAASSVVDNAFNTVVNKFGVGNVLGWGGAKLIYFAFPGFGEIFDRTYRLIADNHDKSGIVSGIISKIAGATGGMLSLLKHSLPTGILTVILAYTISIFLYGFLVTALSIILVASLLIIKIAYYFIEVIISVFVSKAIILWSLVFDRQRAMSSMQDFAYKIMLLVFSPIAIVLSVYVFMFTKAIIFYLYGMFMEAIYYVSQSASGISTNSIGGAFTSIEVYAVYNIGTMILSFLSLFIAFNIFFKFYDWMLGYFGHKGEAGISSLNVFEDIKARTMRA